jgi:L-asparaginase
VGIIYSHAGITPDIANAMLSSGYRGIVHAGVGNGNIHKEIFPVLDQARANNIIVVRSSRVPTGPTTLENEVDDQAHQFVASQWLNPQKSRVLLMLALTRTHDWQQIQKYFNSISK